MPIVVPAGKADGVFARVVPVSRGPAGIGVDGLKAGTTETGNGSAGDCFESGAAVRVVGGIESIVSNAMRCDFMILGRISNQLWGVFGEPGCREHGARGTKLPHPRKDLSESPFAVLKLLLELKVAAVFVGQVELLDIEGEMDGRVRAAHEPTPAFSRAADPRVICS